jgi:hypothetical protein
MIDHKIKTQFVSILRMNEEMVLTRNIAHFLVYKDSSILLNINDKCVDILNDNDSISILLSIFIVIFSVFVT